MALALAASLLSGTALAQHAPEAPTVRAAPRAEEADPVRGEAAPERARPRRRRLAFREGTIPAGFRDISTTGTYMSALFSLRGADRPSEPTWTRVNRFDGFMRARLELRGRAGAAIGPASDVLLYTVAAFPVVIDDLVLALVGDQNPALAARLLAIDSQSFALTGLLVGVENLATARERPYAREASCQTDASGAGCDRSDRSASFFSRDAAMAFTGAGLTCFHQQQLAGLYGTRRAGLAVCGSAMALAMATPLFEVMSGAHWATDVLAGAGVGLFSGWLLPWLMHGRTLLRFDGAYLRGSVGPMVSQGAFGFRGRVYF